MAEQRLRPAYSFETAPVLQAPALRPRIAPARTVLAIEPNIMALDVYRMALKPLRCALMHAPNGAQALQTVQRIKPDLIVMELFLPGMSALDTLEALEQVPDLGAVPVIAISSLPPQEILPPALIAELADFFVKPIDAARLLNVARRFLV
jgi:CheY-like chemotaxis protein